MTPNRNLIALFLAIAWIENITAASFSNVIVQRGPVDYINYNPSALTFASSQLAQLSSEPFESMASIPSISSIVPPCAAPCVISNVPSLASIPSTTNAKIITYKSPLANVPVVVANKDDARGYQYSYAVFDEDTGDKKTQSERSDGSVVQGQYSFIQPDGFRREVIYTADDTKGFNAVVRNISPVPEHPTKEKVDVSKEIIKPAPPCSENKNEHLTHANHEAQASHEASSEEDHSKIEHTEDKKSEENSDAKSGESSEEKSSEKSTEKTAEKSVEKSGEKSAEKSAETSEEKSGEKSTEKSTEKIKEKSQEESSQSAESGQSAEATHSAHQTPNGVVSYDDIINCLQSKLKGGRNIVSPLTYVLVPSSMRPC